MLVYIGFPPAEQETLEGSASSIGVLEQTRFLKSIDPLIELANDIGSMAPKEIPTVVLLNLDESDWRVVLKALKSHAVLRRLPVIGLGRITDQGCIDEIYDLGASSYIAKPKTFSEIVDATVICQKYWLECIQLPAPYLADL